MAKEIEETIQGEGMDQTVRFIVRDTVTGKVEWESGDIKQFRTLDGDEAETFRQWARDHYEPGKQPESFWHPVIRAEWACLELANG